MQFYGDVDGDIEVNGFLRSLNYVYSWHAFLADFGQLMHNRSFAICLASRHLMESDNVLLLKQKADIKCNRFGQFGAMISTNTLSYHFMSVTLEKIYVWLDQPGGC